MQFNPKLETVVSLKVFRTYSDVEAISSFLELGLSSSKAAVNALAKTNALIVIKPNWIQESHEYERDVWLPVITHPALILATIKAIDRLAQQPVTVCICDAPHTYADFHQIRQRGDFDDQLQACEPSLKHVRIEVLDLRREIWIRKEEVIVDRKKNSEDPRGYVAVNLGRDSLFYDFEGEGRYYGADYDAGVVNAHHHGETQEYLLAGTPMKCDLFINLPKLKTHKKTGITCCLKNLVGINGDKNWLPHHTCGYPSKGGDEFPQQRMANMIEDRLKRLGRFAMTELPGIGNWIYRKMRNTGKALLGDSGKVIRNGNWKGNDTCWRMALDLNRALLYGNSDGTWREADQPKAYFAIVDGVIGGQGNGPLCPDAADSHVLVSGDNPGIVDAVCAKIMGFVPGDLPIVRHAFDEHRWPIASGQIDDISVLDHRLQREVKICELAPAMTTAFRPHFGWSELTRRSTVDVAV